MLRNQRIFSAWDVHVPAVHAFGADVLVSALTVFLPCEDSISLADSLNRIRWTFERSMIITSFSLCLLAQSLAGISNDTRIQWSLRRINSDAELESSIFISSH